MKINIFRFNPFINTIPYYTSYILSLQEEVSVLQALDYIYMYLDGNIAYRNYRCFEGVCGSCMVHLNGRNVKGCEMILKPGEEYTIDPVKGYPIIRDLVVDYGHERRNMKEDVRYMITSGTTLERK